MESVVVGWRSGMMSMAYTYVLEIEGEEMWFGHLGKGGAHWEPGKPMLIRDPYENSLERRQDEVLHEAGVGLGMAVGQKVLDKFMKEIAENYGRYASGGRNALAESKRTFSTSRSSFGAGLALVEKMPKKGPPAMAAMGPFVKGTQDGKDMYLAVTPDSEVDVSGLYSALR